MSGSDGTKELFTQPAKADVGDGIPMRAWIVAAAVIALIAVGGFVAGSGRRAAQPLNAVLPVDPYAGNLTISNVTMSESTSLSGGKSTYIDGSVKNGGPKTVTAATVQVLFANDEQLPPQVQTTPLTLIRTREPYVDTQMLSAAPLKPGDEREFRLIFEGVGSNWNMQVPQIHITQVETR